MLCNVCVYMLLHVCMLLYVNLFLFVFHTLFNQNSIRFVLHTLLLTTLLVKSWCSYLTPRDNIFCLCCKPYVCICCCVYVCTCITLACVNFMYLLCFIRISQQTPTHSLHIHPQHYHPSHARVSALYKIYKQLKLRSICTSTSFYLI